MPNPASPPRDFFDVSKPLDVIHLLNRKLVVDLLYIDMDTDHSYPIGDVDLEVYGYTASKPDRLLVRIEYIEDDFGNKQVTHKAIVSEVTTPLDTLEQRCAALVPTFCATIEEAYALAQLQAV